MAVATNQLIHREDGHVGGGPVLTGKTLYIGTLAFVDAANGYLTDVINAGANKLAGAIRSGQN